MKKKIGVKPVIEIELEFQEGNSLNIRFDAEAISNFSELEGGLTSFINEDRLPERCAKIIYIGAKSLQSEFTLEEARAIVSEMSPITITEIVNEFNESMGYAKNELQGELQKKLAEQYMSKIMK